MNCRSTLLALALLLAATALAQQSTADSLNSALCADKNGNPETTIGRLQAIGENFALSRPDSALPYFDRAADLARNAAGGKPLLAKTLWMKAKALTNMARYDEALALLTEAGRHYANLRDETGGGDVLNQIGNVHKKQTRYPEARQYYLRALEMAERAGDRVNVAGIHINLAITYDYAGQYDSAIDFYTKALRFFETAEMKKDMAVTLDNMAVVHFYNHDFPKAVADARRANALHRATGNLVALCRGITNLGEMYAEVDSVAAARKCFAEAEAMVGPLKDPRQEAMIYGAWGNLQADCGQFSEAASYYERQLKLLRAIDAPGDIAGVNLNLGKLYGQMKKPALAIPLLEAALAGAEKASDAGMKLECQQALAAALAEKGDFPRAYRFLSEHETLKDSLFTAEKDRQLHEIEAQYEAEKKERVITQQQAALGRQRLALWAAAVAILALAGIGFSLNRSNRQKQEINHLLDGRNAMLTEANAGLQKKLAEAAAKPSPTQHIRDMAVTLTRQDKTVLRLGEIVFIQSDGNYVEIHTTDGKKHSDWQRLKHYAELLAPSGLFCQTHRSYLVNHLHIRERKATDLTMSNGSTVRIGNTLRQGVDRWLDERLGGMPPAVDFVK